jgi:protein-S-isoprenylcysteine O-methyltransferase Ste14
MLDTVFQIYYLAGLILGSIIRTWYLKKYRQSRTTIFRQEGPVLGLLASLWGVAIILPAFYMFTGWLDFASYNMPSWAGFIGMPIFAIALCLLWKSHSDLGRNWSVTTEIKNKHTLVTSGVFQHIRHPMYAAHLLWGAAQALLIQNWLAGLSSLAIFIPLYLLRVPREEQMMIEQFGEEYRNYTRRTGQILPHLYKQHRSKTLK